MKQFNVRSIEFDTYSPAVIAIAIFIGSFLLFQVQLVLGKIILPWFGGSPGVWNTCLLFFQFMLLLGYVYAHLLTTLELRQQVFIHVALLLISLAFLPIIPSASWKSSCGEFPALRVILLLGATVGLPYFLLSASAPLLQYWHVRRFPNISPWRLYALSNASSLLGLISYPFFFEPLLGVNAQGIFWGVSYGAYVAAICAIGLFTMLSKFTQADKEMTGQICPSEQQSGPRQLYDIFLWIIISSSSTAALLAVTNELTQDVASIPLLWMLPLVVYLATFIICFSKASHYNYQLWSIVLILLVLGSEYIKIGSISMGVLWQIVINLILLLACCMVCHGELVRLRPAADKLTIYYLSIAAGGVLGSAFVSLIAPLLFTIIVELPIALAATFGVLLLAHLYKPAHSRWHVTKVAVMAGLITQFCYSFYFIHQAGSLGVVRYRSFFGTLLVEDSETNFGPMRRLVHGTTVHGYQYLHPENRAYPTSYYALETGVGVTLKFFSQQENSSLPFLNKHVGVIGLGVGTLASYGMAGDTYRFYEINDDVIRIARQNFSFLADSKAEIEVVHKDARLALEEELSSGGGQQFDILIVDAFTSDSIPIHLLTREAVVLYAKHLKPDGVLLFNISSRNFNLWPVIKGHGLALGMESALLSSGTTNMGKDSATWGVLTRNTDFLRQYEVRSLMQQSDTSPINWTDSFASILHVLI